MLRGVVGALRRGAVGPASAASRLPRRGLEEFIDTDTRRGEDPIAGRAWTVTELRQKSFDDLHKLWWVLYKEKNLLLTEKLVTRRKGGNELRAPDRAKKVSMSMKAVRHVVDEREKRRMQIKADKEAAEALAKFQAVRAAALARGAAPQNAPDVIAARKAAKAQAAADAAAAVSAGTDNQSTESHSTPHQ
eukprot:TRINITY_DN3280_c0_g1_i1.p1 TRINITY_DN3280_c0_g1~~TRINITY_DN3280_c0_g1_i1.p1  ORF type:complete len:190 (-),score=46.75 TRINITY_DN3280_c0_g1_i1:208-777(-)